MVLFIFTSMVYKCLKNYKKKYNKKERLLARGKHSESSEEDDEDLKKYQTKKEE